MEEGVTDRTIRCTEAKHRNKACAGACQRKIIRCPGAKHSNMAYGVVCHRKNMRDAGARHWNMSRWAQSLWMFQAPLHIANLTCWGEGVTSPYFGSAEHVDVDTQKLLQVSSEKTEHLIGRSTCAWHGRGVREHVGHRHSDCFQGWTGQRAWHFSSTWHAHGTPC